jgi:hypothetical protein
MKRQIDLGRFRDDAAVDAFLREWPAPSRPDMAWDERADAIVEAATVHKGAGLEDAHTLDSLLEAPALGSEPGEPSSPSSAGGPRPSGVVPSMLRVSGETKMSDENQDPTAPPPSLASGPRSRRGSLKEMAERVSRAPMSSPGSGRGSIPGAPPSSLSGTAPLSMRGAASTPVPSARPSLSNPVPSRPATASRPSISSKPVEAGKDDSGVLDLHAIRSAATKEEEEAAARAQPAKHDLVDDEPAAPSSRANGAAASSKAAVAKGAGKPKAVAATAAPAEKKGGSGAGWGIAIAVVGIAAAVAFTQRGRFTTAPPSTPVATEAAEAPPTEAQPQAAQNPTPAPAATAGADEGVALNDIPKPAAVPGPLPAGGPLPKSGDPAGAAAPAPASTGEAKAAAPAIPPAPGSPGDLASEMAKAVGADGKPLNQGDVGQPAAGGSKNSTVPEQPPQGSVSAAVGSVMGAAKGCVSGADDVSRAQITFGSSGAVKSVSVTGWAASNGATGCVKSALQSANVGAFSKPSFTVGVTIRP